MISPTASQETGPRTAGDLNGKQPEYAWVRPQLRGSDCEINLYVRYSVLGEISEKLRQYAGEETLNLFLSGPFGKLLELKTKSLSNKALHELLAREITHPTFGPFEKWFFLGGDYIRFTATDFALVTGLMFGDSMFKPSERHHIPQTSMLRTKYSSRRIKVSTLRRDFKAGNLNSASEYLKAANLLMYYLILLGRDNPWIEDWAWVLVEDEVGWSSFPWGSYSFQVLCNQISLLPKCPSDLNMDRNSYTFFGPTWALAIWSYEAIPDLGYMCGSCNLQALTPRFRRWTTRRTTGDYSDIFDEFKLPCQLSLDPGSNELHSPYYLSSIRTDALALLYMAPKRHASRKVATDLLSFELGGQGSILVNNNKRKNRSPPSRLHEKQQEECMQEGSSYGIRCVHGDTCFICLEGECWANRLAQLVSMKLRGECHDTGIMESLASRIAEELKYSVVCTEPLAGSCELGKFNCA